VNLFGNRRKMERKSAQVEAHWYRCGSCGKTFAKSLKMLNFEHEPPKEIEICPFCDKVLTK